MITMTVIITAPIILICFQCQTIDMMKAVLIFV